MIENRRFKRYPYSLKMIVEGIYNQAQDEKEIVNAEVKIRDISRRGLGFDSDANLPLEAFFNVNIIFEEGTHFLAVVKIIRKQIVPGGFTYGSEFVGLAETLAERIDQINEDL